MAQYFTVKAVFEVEDAKGKIKKQTENYLVDAMSVRANLFACCVPYYRQCAP